MEVSSWVGKIPMEKGMVTHQEDPLGEGNGNPLQYFSLENPMDGGTWCATVCGFTKQWDRT